jgi:hypothetical protein
MRPAQNLGSEPELVTLQETLTSPPRPIALSVGQRNAFPLGLGASGNDKKPDPGQPGLRCQAASARSPADAGSVWMKAARDSINVSKGFQLFPTRAAKLSRMFPRIIRQYSPFG